MLLFLLPSKFNSANATNISRLNTRPSYFRRAANHFQRQAGFTDFIALPYIVVILRQYCWMIENNAAAWCFTIALSILAWFFYLTLKEPAEESTCKLFWLIVALPLFLVYAIRAAFPDLSYDVLAYHVFHAERALRGELSIPGDFFPSYFPLLNPAPDMLTGIYRHGLGYRMGTIVNYLALLWAGIVLDKILRRYLPHAALRCFGVLLVLWSEHLLFEINNYMVDLLALPLLLEATYRVIRDDEAQDQTRTAIFIALLLGSSVAFKLNNLVFALPVALVYSSRFIARKNSTRLKISWLGAVSAVIAAVLPLLPHTSYLYARLQSPVFPFYNKLFKSPFFPPQNGYDERWGARGLSETLLWPVMAVFKPQRLSEIGVYTGRISVGFIGALICLLLARPDQRRRLVCVILISGSLLWSAATGYIRYGLYLEALSGVVLLSLSAYFLQLSARFPVPVKWFLAIAPWFFLCGQSLIATKYVLGHEWGGRPTIFDDFRGHGKESHYLFNDRSLAQYFSSEESASFKNADVWIESAHKSSAVMVMLNERAPLIAVDRPEFFTTAPVREIFRQSLQAARGKRMFSLCPVADLETATKWLHRERFVIKSVTPITVPYYSHDVHLDMMLIEVAPPDITANDVQNGILPLYLLPDNSFKAEISLSDKPRVLQAGQSATIRVRVRNISESVWSARGESDGRYMVEIGNKWLDRNNRMVISDDGRSQFPADLKPGDEAEISLRIRAPQEIGEYVLEIDAVQENAAWFKNKGSVPYKLNVRIDP